MRVADLGEFGLIELLAHEFGVQYPPSPSQQARPGLIVDLGDDAAVSQPRDAAALWTTDTMVDGVHFDSQRSSWLDVGWRAMAVNVSDIAAMGGTPFIALVTLCLPADFLVDDAISFYRGLSEAAKAFDVTVVGGDIVRAPAFTVTVALSGWADAPLGVPLLLRRNAAELGDIVAVSGTLGDSAAGLRLMQEGRYTNTEAERHLRIAHQRPQPRIELGRASVGAGLRCGIDISDGLMQDLGHVAHASNVGIRVDAARVPISEALKQVFPAQALGLALSGGEDYELALIGPRLLVESLLGGPTLLTEIGEVVHYEVPRVAAVDATGTEIPLGPGGWDHFADS